MLSGRVVAAAQLTDLQIREMFHIMEKYYENILWRNFERDLKEKRDVVLLCDESDNIRGFTTLTIFPYSREVQLLFSGDTIIEKEYWGDNDLSEKWIKNAFTYAESFEGKTYWLLLTKGYKTYKFLHTFFHVFCPSVDQETPEEMQEILDGFGDSQYGDKYRRGILVAGKDYLKGEFAQIDPIKLKNKHTAFFLEKNPNYAQGDELVCLTLLSLDNLNRLGRKMIGR